MIRSNYSVLATTSAMLSDPSSETLGYANKVSDILYLTHSGKRNSYKPKVAVSGRAPASETVVGSERMPNICMVQRPVSTSIAVEATTSRLLMAICLCDE